MLTLRHRTAEQSPTTQPVRLYNALILKVEAHPEVEADTPSLPAELTKEILKYIPERAQRKKLFCILGATFGGQLSTGRAGVRLPELILEGQTRRDIAKAGKFARGNIRLLLQCLASDEPMYQAIALEALIQARQRPFPKYSSWTRAVPSKNGYVQDHPDYYVPALFVPGLSHKCTYEYGRRCYERTTEPEIKLAMLSALLRHKGPTAVYQNTPEGDTVVSNLQDIVAFYDWQFGELEKHKKGLVNDYGRLLVMLAKGVPGVLWRKLLDAAWSVTDAGTPLLSEAEQVDLIRHLLKTLAQTAPDGALTVSQQREIVAAIKKLTFPRQIVRGFAAALAYLPEEEANALFQELAASKNMGPSWLLKMRISESFALISRNIDTDLDFDDASDEEKLDAISYCTTALKQENETPNQRETRRYIANSLANAIDNNEIRNEARILTNTKIAQPDPVKAWTIFKEKSECSPPDKRYFLALDFLGCYRGMTLNAKLLKDIKRFAEKDMAAAFAPMEAKGRKTELRLAIELASFHTQLDEASDKVQQLLSLPRGSRIAALLIWMGDFSVKHIFNYEGSKRIDTKRLDPYVLTNVADVAADIFEFAQKCAPWDRMEILVELEKWKLKEKAEILLASLKEEDEIYETFTSLCAEYPDIDSEIEALRRRVMHGLPDDLVSHVVQ